MQDVTVAVKHYRYEPDAPPGVYTTPFFGEVVTGEVIEVSGDRAQQAANDPSWTKATKKDYDNQPSHGEQLDAVQQPYIGEEE